MEPEFHGITGWPATPKLMPVVILCELALHMGKEASSKSYME